MEGKENDMKKSSYFSEVKRRKMKTLSFFAALICAALVAKAQMEIKSVGDTLGPWTTINFEESSPYIQNSPSMQNMWMIGKPQKTLFNQAFSVPNAMVTELMSFYLPNNHSSFDLYIGDFNSNWMFRWNLFIDFRHKIDSDTLHDGGFITISWDKGKSWMNILDDTIGRQFYCITPGQASRFWGNTNLYHLTDTLYNGEHGFSGSSNGWIHSCMAWYNLPVKHADIVPPDTMILRFNFISDNIHHNREGWMIDDIRIFSLDLGSGINESSKGSIHAHVTPNPLKNNALVTLDKMYEHVEYLLIDPSGRILQTGKPGKCREFTIQRGGLSPGIYLFKLTSGNNISEVTRIIVI
jgi:hypothetical protein